MCNYEYEFEFEFENEEFDFNAEIDLVSPVASSLLEYSSRGYSYGIDCWFTRQFIDFPEESDQGHFIRRELMSQIVERHSLIEEIRAYKQSVRSILVDQFAKIAHRKHFHEQITEELIAESMHPRRMMARIGQFDDIERFFECC
jgi:hypothetical protein